MSDEITVLDLDWDLIQHLADSDTFYKLQAEQFTSDLIQDELAEKVWNFQLEHARNHGTPASASVLEDQFEEVFIEKPQTALGDLLERLRSRYVRNEGQQALEDIARLTKSDPLAVARQMIQEGRRINDLVESRGESFSETDFELALKDYDERKLRGRGPSMGFAEIDDHFHGQDGLTFLVGGPKSYKSWFTINAVLSNVRYGGSPYLYSLELPAAHATWRLLCMKADIPYWKYLRTALEVDEREELRRATDELQGFGQYRIDHPQGGDRSVDSLVSRAMNAGSDCIFVDQLQYVETRKGNALGAGNDTKEYFEVLNDFRDYSDQIPIFIVHQFNRSIMNAEGMPEPQQGKSSSAIEEVATLELGLWANKDMRSSNIVHMGTLMSRHYSHATWECGVELSKGCGLTLNGPA